jgi:hypothetical protein
MTGFSLPRVACEQAPTVEFMILGWVGVCADPTGSGKRRPDREDSPSAVFSFPAEEVLLGEAGEGAEVGAAEVGDVGGFPAVEAVAAGEGFEHPRIHGEGLEFAGAEEGTQSATFSPTPGSSMSRALAAGYGSDSVSSSQPGRVARNFAVSAM